MLSYALILMAKFCILTNCIFIVPNEVTDSMEIFQYKNDQEFIVNNFAVTWNQANYICTHVLNGSLAYFENKIVIKFVTEYLAESDMSLNTLWVNIRKDPIQDKWKTWNEKTVNERIFKCPCQNGSNLCANCIDSRNCGAIVRMYHSDPCFVKLQCDARRKFICRRSITDAAKSIHLDWIKIGNKLYKIFYERLTHDRAMEACTLHDVKSKLAVIETFEEAQTLGRFLLIGRPSKERVWIGARWGYDSYEFKDPTILLSNMTDLSGYPPWLTGNISKPFGCILLDRHLDDLTYFIESNCNRRHSLMCCKDYESPNFVQVCFVGSFDWRIFYTAQNWFVASETCRNSHSTGRLPYIESQDLKSIIHVMETSQFDVLYHVWLGAYFENQVWNWTYNNRVLLQESVDGFPPWVMNLTHHPDIEKSNLCLNLDREDSLESIFYGTNCYYPQYFICQYDQRSICNATTQAPTITLTTPAAAPHPTSTTTTLTTPPPTTSTTDFTTPPPTTTNTGFTSPRTTTTTTTLTTPPPTSNTTVFTTPRTTIRITTKRLLRKRLGRRRRKNKT